MKNLAASQAWPSCESWGKLEERARSLRLSSRELGGMWYRIVQESPKLPPGADTHMRDEHQAFLVGEWLHKTDREWYEMADVVFNGYRSFR